MATSHVSHVEMGLLIMENSAIINCPDVPMTVKQTQAINAQEMCALSNVEMVGLMIKNNVITN